MSTSSIKSVNSDGSSTPPDSPPALDTGTLVEVVSTSVSSGADVTDGLNNLSELLSNIQVKEEHPFDVIAEELNLTRSADEKESVSRILYDLILDSSWEIHVPAENTKRNLTLAIAALRTTPIGIKSSRNPNAAKTVTMSAEDYTEAVTSRTEQSQDSESKVFAVKAFERLLRNPFSSAFLELHDNHFNHTFDLRTQEGTYSPTWSTKTVIWVQAPWCMGIISTLLTNILDWACKIQWSNDYLVLGLVHPANDFPYTIVHKWSDQYDLPRVKSHAAEKGYKYLGFSRSMMELMYILGYQHESDTGNDINHLVKPHLVLHCWRRK